MDATLINALPDAAKQRYSELVSLLDHPGFKAVVEDLQEQAESLQATIENAASWDHYTYARGYRDALAYMVELDKRIEADFTSYAEQLQAEEQTIAESPEDFL